MTGPTDELILVDGPGAGKRVRFDPRWSSTYYVLRSWPEVGDLMSPGSYDEMTFFGSTETVYRIGRIYDMNRQPVRIGWCSGESWPDPEQIEYWVRFEPSVKVIADPAFLSTGLMTGCDFAVLVDQANATIQGTCPCGWKTEAVPRRRTREVVELVYAHRKISTAAVLGVGVGINARAIRKATRYEALLAGAEAVGMSRSRAEEIFRGEEFRNYSFDEAIERLEHRLRLFTMYGYEPVAVRDVLPWRDIRAQQIDPEMILNRPRWMPDPLGRQFAEMGRDRQRVLVEAAIELTAQLGDVGGWPLERAMAVVMPHKEDSRR